MKNATAVEIKKELHHLIDLMPMKKLKALRPLLYVLHEQEDAVIETDLTPEEIKIIQDGEKEFEEHPENFIPFE